MQTIDQLIDTQDPGIALLREWAAQKGSNQSIILSPEQNLRKHALEYLQVTTRSLLGAVVYETGGVLIAKGRLRIFGSGHARSIQNSNKTVSEFKQGSRSKILLIADDILGGLYAMNGGCFGQDKMGEIFYLPADDTNWTPMDVGYSDFVSWCLTGDLSIIYQDLNKIKEFNSNNQLNIDQVYSFFPFLWTKEGRKNKSDARLIDADESLRLRIELLGFRHTH